jgi:DNA-binding PadR family transcriptional regulator
MDFSKELIKGSTKKLILSVLNEGELYGYEIIKAIKIKSADALAFGEGSIYPALHQLEKDGYLKSRWEAGRPGTPPRKYYQITEKGKLRLNADLKEWKEFTQAVDSVLVKLSSN